MPLILLFAGTRPEIIKMAPLYWSLYKRDIPVVFYTTGQHTTLSAQAAASFAINPQELVFKDELPKNLALLTGKLLERAASILEHIEPDLVVVHGDTATAFASALAAFFKKIPVAHVEAGLRTHDTQQPFPEEFNRQAISRVAGVHFVPTEQAKQNLQAERVAGEIIVTGNTIVDALFYMLNKIEQEPGIITNTIHELINTCIKANFKIILITLHRRELYLSGNYEKIVKALIALAQNTKACTIIFVTHPNPEIQKLILNYNQGCLENIYWLPPLEYHDLIYCLQNAHFVITDSGGIIEEAAILECPTIIVREKIERFETVSSKNAVLVGYDTIKLVQEINFLLAQPRKERHLNINIYGDGTASEKIADYIINYLKRA